MLPNPKEVDTLHHGQLDAVRKSFKLKETAKICGPLRSDS
jgi:hypothetical protein